MDKSLKILKRKQAATLRLRKINTVHERLLEGKIRILSTSFEQLRRELKKETQSLRAEMEETKPALQLPGIDSAKSSIGESRSQSRLSENARVSRSTSQESGVCNTCHYDPTNTERCKHFPCYLPVTYNSIGFITKSPSYSNTGNYKRLLQRCRDLRPPTSQVQPEVKVSDNTFSDLYESKAPRTTVKEKIRGLKLLVKEMKERNEKTKPKEWAVKYGEPTPRRFILKPLKTNV